MRFDLGLMVARFDEVCIDNPPDTMLAHHAPPIVGSSFNVYRRSLFPEGPEGPRKDSAVHVSLSSYPLVKEHEGLDPRPDPPTSRREIHPETRPIVSGRSRKRTTRDPAEPETGGASSTPSFSEPTASVLREKLEGESLRRQRRRRPR